MLTPADWVIAIRLIDWAIEFLSRPDVAQLDPRICRGRRSEAKQALETAVDVQMAMLRLCFAQMLDRVYRGAAESVALGPRTMALRTVCAIGHQMTLSRIQSLAGFQSVALRAHLLALQTS